MPLGGSAVSPRACGGTGLPFSSICLPVGGLTQAAPCTQAPRGGHSEQSSAPSPLSASASGSLGRKQAWSGV